MPKVNKALPVQKAFAAPEVNHAPKGGPTPQEKFAQARTALNKAMVGWSEGIDAMLCAVLSREHVLYVGGYGIGKSHAINGLCSWIEGARQCTVHFCKDSTRSMMFGDKDIQAMLRGENKRILEGGAADAHFINAEELFKAGPAVWGQWFLILNERTYKEGVFHRKCPLETVFASSNEWEPEGCQEAVKAFSDRFTYRMEMLGVRDQAGKKELLRRAVDNDPCLPKFPETITLPEIHQAQIEVRNLPVTGAAKLALWKIVTELDKGWTEPQPDGSVAKRGGGVEPSPRRLMKTIGAARAAAYLAGAKEVLPEHLAVLQHVLWDDPTEQPKTCRQTVLRHANPMELVLAGLREEMSEVVDNAPAGEALVKLKDIGTKLAKAAGAEAAMADYHLNRTESANYLKLIEDRKPDARILDAAKQLVDEIATAYAKVRGVRTEEE